MPIPCDKFQTALHTQGFAQRRAGTRIWSLDRPAYAGIYRRNLKNSASAAGPPCIRRDLPVADYLLRAFKMTALHTQGFTLIAENSIAGSADRPAHAGIYQPSFRRIPDFRQTALHTQGFTGEGTAEKQQDRPAYAGIYLYRRTRNSDARCDAAPRRRDGRPTASRTRKSARSCASSARDRRRYDVVGPVPQRIRRPSPRRTPPRRRPPAAACGRRERNGSAARNVSTKGRAI